jgi:hypothetical protein
MRTTARVRLRRVSDELSLTRIDLDTVGDVPGINEDEFQAYAKRAKAECPISWAVAAVPEIALTARLAVAHSSPDPTAGRDDEEVGSADRRRRPRAAPTTIRLEDRHYLALVAAQLHRMASDRRASQKGISQNGRVRA